MIQRHSDASADTAEGGGGGGWGGQRGRGEEGAENEGGGKETDISNISNEDHNQTYCLTG